MKEKKNLLKRAAIFMTAAFAACMLLAVNPTVAKAADFTVNFTGYTTSSVTVSWPAVEGATDYLVEFGNYEVVTRATSYTIQNLYPGNDFSVVVTAYSDSDRLAYDYCYVSSAPVITDIALYDWKPGTSNATLYVNDEANARGYVDGYDVEILSNKGKVIKTESVSTSSSYYTVANSAIKNKGFVTRFRPYMKTSDGAIVYGDWTAYETYVPQPKVTAKYRRSYGKMSITLKWKKVKGAKSYSIYRKVGVNGKYKKVKTVKGTSYAKSGLSNSKTYCYYVVANKVPVMGKKYSSSVDDSVYYFRF